MKGRKQIPNNKPKHNINENIKFDNMQVITSEGENLGLLSKKEALSIAQQKGLDLVLVSSGSKEGQIVAKIMDFGKVLYAKKKQAAEAKKKQAVVQVKEIRLTPNVGEHDFETKLNHAVGFLKKGKHVKFNIRFKGREMASQKERGQDMFNKVDEKLRESGVKFTKEKESRSGRFWSIIYYVK